MDSSPLALVVLSAKTELEAIRMALSNMAAAATKRKAARMDGAFKPICAD